MKTRFSNSDFTGKVFDRLICLEKDVELSKTRGRIHWKCECICGKIISV